MKVYVAYAGEDGEQIVRKLRKLLDQDDMEVLSYYDVMAGEDWNVSIANDILSADLVVALFTHYALQNNNFKKVVLTAEKYNKKVIPVYFDSEEPDRNLSLGLMDLKGLNCYLDNVTEAAESIASTVMYHFSQRKKQAEKKRIEKENEQAQISNYVDKTIKRLEEGEIRNKKMANTMYFCSAISIILSIAISVAFFLSVKTISNGDVSITVVLCSTVVLIDALIASLSKFLFTLGKSYMVESIRNSDRIHAIYFGRFFLEAYGDVATIADVKEVFGQWNIDNGGTLFRNQTSEDIDPKLDKLIGKNKS